MNESLKKQHQRPEGALIERALAGPPKRSRRKLADSVGLSEGRIRQIINGYRTEANQVLEIQAPTDTLWRIADELGIASDEMRAAGRADVADLLQDRPKAGITEEGDLWISTLEEETKALEDWLATDRTERPPTEALALWETTELLEAAVRSHRDALRFNTHLVQVLQNSKQRVSDELDELSKRRGAEVSESDESLEPAADDVIPDVDESPGGSDERD